MANFKDDKSSFQNNFIDKYGAEFPCVPRDDGGATFNIVLDNQNWGGPVYLIKPDSTFILGRENGMEQDLIDAGIKPHQCVTPGTTKPVVALRQSMARVLQMTPNSIKLDVLTEGTYSVTVYAIDGQQLAVIPAETFSKGLHSLNLAAKVFVDGIYIIKVKGGVFTNCQKVICR